MFQDTIRTLRKRGEERVEAFAVSVGPDEIGATTTDARGEDDKGKRDCSLARTVGGPALGGYR